MTIKHDASQTTGFQPPLVDPLFPGALVTVEGERWVVAAWDSVKGERSIHLQLLGNPGITARWPYDQFVKMLEDHNG